MNATYRVRIVRVSNAMYIIRKMGSDYPFVRVFGDIVDALEWLDGFKELYADYAADLDNTDSFRYEIEIIYSDDKPKRKAVSNDLSIDEANICAYLRMCCDPASPRAIGIEVGYRPATSASSWACRKLKPLLARGVVEKNEKGHYWLGENAK